MTISVWRYSHLALAVSSFLFIALASFTGIILSFQPITEKVNPYKTRHFDQLNLAQVLPVLTENYTDISEVTIDANHFVLVKGTGKNGKSGHYYVNPETGKSLAEASQKNEFFQWVTTLHRSLFLHETGRFFVGLTSFLLLLIAISGTILIVQRQRSFKRFFAKIARDNFAQYYHVVLGRLLLIPILIVALSGTFLSLKRFEIIKEQKITHQVDFDTLRSKPQIKLTDFEVFKQVSLSDVQSVEFPFSEDVEDYFLLKLVDKEMTVNQVTGDVLTEEVYDRATLLTNLSLDLHTGRTHIIWALVLAFAAGNILFFIYSGFVMTLKRRGNRIKNSWNAEVCEFILFVGSENGTTFSFANAIYQQLIKNGKKAYLTELNRYQVFPKAKHFVVFTSTYGLGEAPTNATKVKKLIAEAEQPNMIDFSVVGFGSHAYPDFCKFAYELNNLLSQQSWANPLLEINTVNDKSPDEFNRWASIWSQKHDLKLTLPPDIINQRSKRMKTFTVVEKTKSAQDDTAFLIRLSGKNKRGFTSGDLLAIYPANDHRERLYSIGKVNGEIQLSVKLHPGGLGSNYLHHLELGETLKACIVPNVHFHFPKQAKKVIMISNGTGIAPFLGMLDQNAKGRECYLYCGFRSRKSFELYDAQILKYTEAKKLSQAHVAYSREGDKYYIKDLLARDAEFVHNTLIQGGIIMICGSLGMQNNVISLLDELCQKNENRDVSYYQSNGQVLMDCY
jgi:sulfite reductase (NADPH) flavoprotein alpha-component